jgi:hypothetical protein
VAWTPTIGTQIVAHLIGDYVLQSHWMAAKKSEKIYLAALHSFIYVIPFLIMRPTWITMAIIIGTHFVIDHWRWSRYVIWAQNMFGPKKYRLPFPKARDSGSAFPGTTPLTLATFLAIISDDVLHMICNSLAFWIGN